MTMSDNEKDNFAKRIVEGQRKGSPMVLNKSIASVLEGYSSVPYSAGEKYGIDRNRMFRVFHVTSKNPEPYNWNFLSNLCKALGIQKTYYLVFAACAHNSAVVSDKESLMLVQGTGIDDFIAGHYNMLVDYANDSVKAHDSSLGCDNTSYAHNTPNKDNKPPKSLTEENTESTPNTEIAVQDMAPYTSAYVNVMFIYNVPEALLTKICSGDSDYVFTSRPLTKEEFDKLGSMFLMSDNTVVYAEHASDDVYKPIPGVGIMLKITTPAPH
mgnify:FL=1